MYVCMYMYECMCLWKHCIWRNLAWELITKVWILVRAKISALWPCCKERLSFITSSYTYNHALVYTIYHREKVHDPPLLVYMVDERICVAAKESRIWESIEPSLAKYLRQPFYEALSNKKHWKDNSYVIKTVNKKRAELLKKVWYSCCMNNNFS